MPYNNWTYRHIPLSAASYVPLHDFVTAMVAARSVPFSVKAARDELRVRLTSLPTVAVDRETRFPEGAYVDITFGVISEMLGRIMVALDHGERTAEREQGESKFSGYNDSKVTVAKSVQAILLILSKDPATVSSEGVYVRHTFETRNDLEWA